MINYPTEKVIREILLRYNDSFLLKFIEEEIKINRNGKVMIAETDYNIDGRTDTILILKEHVRDEPDFTFAEDDKMTDFEEEIRNSLEKGWKPFVKHFKGNIYRVKDIATHTENKEEMVIYQAQYGDEELFVRPAEMFFEEGRFELC